MIRQDNVDYGKTILIQQSLTVGQHVYTVLQRDEFSFYVRHDVLRHIDMDTDSVMMLTQMSDYVFEMVNTSDATQESIMIKGLPKPDKDEEIDNA